ncbi:hypothetical protein MTR_7g104380 [Medicago truncatula]|uniref:Uncharacterized protein n=1 Tax=Medicago truncatula TaxID=3880 RepID=G7L621_MEDTR|nr:hypothetical protein MTR_7g104380 [Medicago truncatula]
MDLNFSFYDRSSSVYTQSQYLPPSKMLDVDITDSVIGEGCAIKNCKIFHSVVGLQSSERKEIHEKLDKWFMILDSCGFGKVPLNLHVFDFLANSILREVLFTIQKGKPGAFSPGRPEFLKNYKSSLEFLAYLEGYCTSRSVVAKFRSEAIYTEFMKQSWSLDSVLTTSSPVPVQNLDPSEVNYQDLTLKSNVTLLESLRLCWREENGCIVTCWQDMSLFSTTAWRARK